MGLFGKKEKIPEGIRVMFYEGDLPGFQLNMPCQILLNDDVLRLTKIKPYVEVNLERNRLKSIDIFTELEYMAKYKGTAVNTSKTKGIEKYYYVVNYADKNGEEKHIDFWSTATENLKMRKMQKEIVNCINPGVYEL